MIKAIKGCSKVLIDAGELRSTVNKARCLSTQVCGHHIELLWNMVVQNYMCCHMVKHTYVYRHMYAGSIHILYICIGRIYAPVYISCIFLLEILMPCYVYMYICIGCTYASTSWGLCPVQPGNQHTLALS